MDKNKQPKSHATEITLNKITLDIIFKLLHPITEPSGKHLTESIKNYSKLTS